MRGQGQGRKKKQPPTLAQNAARASETLRRQPPQNLEAEQAVLGGVLLHPRLLDEMDFILPEHFYSPAHLQIFQAMTALGRDGVPVDLVTLSDRLQRDGQIEAAGGPVYLAELAEQVVSLGNALHHAKIVEEMGKRRAGIGGAAELVGNFYDTSMPLDEIVGQAQRVLDRAVDTARDTAAQRPEQVIRGYIEWLEKAQDGQGGLLTQFKDYNYLCGGVHEGELVVVAARPSNGKTTLGVNLVDHWLDLGVPCGIISLEMRIYSIMSKFFAARGKIYASKFRSFSFNKEDWRRLYDCAEWWRSRPLRFWDLSTITPSQIRAQLRRWHRDIGLRVVLFDYLQLADGEQRSGMGVTREREIAEVTKALKNSANDLGLTVIALAQLRRSAEERKTPLISDIKDCGEIEQAADQIILVKPWKPSEHGKDDFPTVQCILAKSRSSETGKFTLCLDKDWVVFRGEKKTAVTG